MRILLPVDGSECAKSTLEWACKTLDKANTQYVLLSVVTDPMIAEYEIEDAIRILKEGRNYLESNGCRVEKAEYVVGDPVESICKYAVEQDVDQILIGSHGRSGLPKLLLGSVSTGVLERSQVPVFVYRNIERKPAAAKS